MINFTEKEQYTFEDLRRLVTFLRSEDGCPWDHAQTHTSIRRNFIEEAYEACEGIDSDDPALMAEEFGDVLLQVVFHADIEADRGRFSMDQVCDGICRKLIRRHPHLFYGGEVQDWDDLKKKEKGAKSQSQVMDSVARSLPALIRAEKIQEKAAKVGAGWHSAQEAGQELQAQLAALLRAEAGSREAEEAMGKLLYAAVSAGIARQCDPESSLQQYCEAYIKNFAAGERTSH